MPGLDEAGEYNRTGIGKIKSETGIATNTIGVEQQVRAEKSDEWGIYRLQDVR